MIDTLVESLVVFFGKGLKRHRLRFCFFLLFSLLLHISLILFLTEPLQSDNSFSGEEMQPIAYVDFRPRHFVNQSTFNKITPKKPTPYISKYDQSVEQETQAMLQGLFHHVGTESGNDDTHQEQSSEHEDSQLTALDLPRWEESHKRELSSLGKEVVSRIVNAPLELDSSALDGREFNSAIGDAGDSHIPNFLPGVELGEKTRLNTLEFPFYSFLSRVKKQVYLRWIQYFREQPYILHDKQFHEGVLSTQLYVSLSPEGEIENMAVLKSSGSENIDFAAMHAFTASEPFHNPPADLVMEDGLIHFNYGFFVY